MKKGDVIMKAGTSGKPAIPVVLGVDKLVEELLKKKGITNKNHPDYHCVFEAMELAIEAGRQEALDEIKRKENEPCKECGCDRGYHYEHCSKAMIT